MCLHHIHLTIFTDLKLCRSQNWKDIKISLPLCFLFFYLGSTAWVSLNRVPGRSALLVWMWWWGNCVVMIWCSPRLRSAVFPCRGNPSRFLQNSLPANRFQREIYCLYILPRLGQLDLRGDAQLHSLYRWKVSFSYHWIVLPPNITVTHSKRPDNKQSTDNQPDKWVDKGGGDVT